MGYISKAVDSLIQKYKTRCPFKLAEHLGIEIYEYPFQSKKGLIVPYNGKKTIGLNANLNKLEKKNVIAFEIGYELFNPVDVGYFFIQENTFHTLNKFDRQANLFAAALLFDVSPGSGETILQYSKRDIVKPCLAKKKFLIIASIRDKTII